MNCLFDKEKECPLGGKITLENMGRFCQACVGKDATKITAQALEVAKESLSKSEEITGGTKAHLILALLRLFPKEEDKAKLEYQKLMKRVEEW